MKKITLLITIILCLVMGLAGTTMVFAETTAPSMEMSITGGSAYQGNYVYLYVSCANLEDVVGVDIHVYYDEASFSVGNVYAQSGLNGTTNSIKHDVPGEVSVNVVSMTPICKDGNSLFYIPLYVRPDAVVGKHPITLAVGEAYGSDLSVKNIATHSSYVTVMENKPSKTNAYFYASVDKSIGEGEVATLNYYSNSSNLFASGDFTVDYDSNALQLESVTLSSILSNSNVQASVNDILPGYAKIAFSALDNVSYGCMFTLKFVALNNEDATSSVVINANNLYNKALESVGANEVTSTIKTVYTPPEVLAPKVKLDSYNGYDADFYVDLMVDGATRLAAGDFVLEYNTAFLTCTSVEKLSIDDILTVNPKFAGGTIRFSYINEAGISTDTAIARIIFKVNKVGTSIVGVSGTALVDAQFNAQDVEYVNANIVTEHEMIDVPRLAPTCTQKGHEAYKRCKHCGYTTDIVELPATGHSYVSKVVLPTCTMQGYTEHKCSNCGDVVRDNYVSALGHDYNVVVIPPTCTEKGYTTHTCNRCGESYVDSYVDATGHTFGEWQVTTPPTCTTLGEETRYCTHCDAVETREVSMLPHAYVDEIVAPTCTTKGYTIHTCNDCGKVVKDTYVSELGHNYDAVVTPPTCTERGYTTHTCSRCGESYLDSYVEATGHTFSEWSTTKAPTCTTKGEETRHCLNCELVETREVPALGHDYLDIVVPPTCTEQGYTEHTCSRGDHTYRDNYVKAKGHSYEAVVTPPSHSKRGYTTYTCRDCGHSYVSDYVDVVPHTFGEWQVVIPPTCTENGLEKRVCTDADCGYSETRVVLALGHDYNAVVTSPTCTEKGYTTHTCSRCGESYVDSYVEPTGHTFGEWQVTTAPTCTTQGEETRHCLKCGKVEKRIVQAKGHQYTDAIILPTCTEKGYTKHICLVCGNIIKDTYVPALGHVYESIVTPPTCTERGYTTHTCSRCGESYIDSYVEPTGHVFGGWVMTKEPTCFDDGIEVRKCAHCDATERRAVPKLVHEYNAVVTAPTCTEQGYTTYTCTHCGDTYRGDYVNAIGHKYKNWTVTLEPTCTKSGQRERICELCHGKEVENIPSLGHEYIDTVVLPTCKDRGYTLHKCTRCDEQYIDSYTAAKGHAFGPWQVVEEATCLHIGKKMRVCSECGETEVVQVPTKHHAYEEIVVEPTCKNKGYTLFKCSECGHSYISNSVPALGHQYVDTVVEPTCTTKGYVEHVCSRCGEKYTSDEVPALGHTYEDIITPPTCTERGYTTHKCKHCDKAYVDSYVPALGHVYGDWMTTKEPTITEEGERQRVCSECGDIIKESIPRLEPPAPDIPDVNPDPPIPSEPDNPVEPDINTNGDNASLAMKVGLGVGIPSSVILIVGLVIFFVKRK